MYQGSILSNSHHPELHSTQVRPAGITQYKPHFLALHDMKINFLQAKQGLKVAHDCPVVTDVFSSPLFSNSIWSLSRCEASTFITPATFSIPFNDENLYASYKESDRTMQSTLSNTV